MTPAELLATYDTLQLHHANEAETRLKLIDLILFQVLGWTHADVEVEPRVSEDGTTTFADYILRTAMSAVVVEAKKVGASFGEVPIIRRAQLRGRIMSGETGNAIIQARDYARKLGIPFAAATNGSCWIIFPATRIDQVAFADSSAIVFPSLRSILQDDYAEFHDLLSRQAVINGSLEAELLGRVANQIEERRLNRFYERGFSRASRHSFFPLIDEAVTIAFSEDIASKHPDLLEKCYVRTPERTRYDSRIMMHIARRQAVIARPPKRPLRNDENALREIIGSAATRSRPVAILVLGTVGVGKTTFLTFTHDIASKDLFNPNQGRPYPHWMRIDFKGFIRGQSVSDFLFSALKNHINDEPFLSNYERCVRHAYKAETDALLKGPLYLLADDETEMKRRITELLMLDYEKTVPYVEKVLSYAATNAPVFLVVDNVDQIEDDAQQAAIFSDAMALANKLGLSLVCSLREATYVRHRNSPAFDAFDFEPIQIDSPRVDAVLSKRFFLARQLLDAQTGVFTAENGAEFKIGNLATLIDLVQSSVLGTEVGNLIDVMAASDIRLALRMTRRFLQSGYTASGRALEIFQSTGTYVMPPHEAMRAIMLGNQPVYSDEHSDIGNPFDAKLARTEAQLLRLYVLAALVSFSSQKSFQFLSGTEIQRALREIGFGDETTLAVLADLCRFRFAHTLSHTNATLDASYLPTRLGGYVVRQLLANFTFIENTVMDTFISDRAVWDRLRQLTEGVYSERDTIRRLGVRVTRARAFFQYMRECYQPLHDESVRRGLSREWCTHPLEALLTQFQLNLDRVLRSAQRIYGGGAQAPQDEGNEDVQGL